MVVGGSGRSSSKWKAEALDPNKYKQREILLAPTFSETVLLCFIFLDLLARDVDYSCIIGLLMLLHFSLAVGVPKPPGLHRVIRNSWALRPVAEASLLKSPPT